MTTEHDASVCALNWCESEPGAGTWTRVTINGVEHTVPVCEEHWQAIKTVRAGLRTPARKGS